ALDHGGLVALAALGDEHDLVPGPLDERRGLAAAPGARRARPARGTSGAGGVLGRLGLLGGPGAAGRLRGGGLLVLGSAGLGALGGAFLGLGGGLRPTRRGRGAPSAPRSTRG